MMKKVCLVAAAAAAVTVSPVAGVKLHRRGEGDAKAEEKPATKEEEKPAASGGLTLPTLAAEPKYKADGEMEKPLEEMKSDDEKKLWFSVLIREYAAKQETPEDVAKKNAEIYKKYGDDMIECGFADKNVVETFKGAGGSSGGICPC